MIRKLEKHHTFQLSSGQLELNQNHFCCFHTTSFFMNGKYNQNDIVRKQPWSNLLSIFKKKKNKTWKGAAD